MKKRISLLMLACTILLASSCATIFGGRVTDCQRTKPAPGEQSRRVRVGALIADIILFWPGAIVDFADNAIYKPCGDGAFVRPLPTANDSAITIAPALPAANDSTFASK